MDSVKEFKCLPVECGHKGAGHYLFIKKCESTKQSVERPPGRTLAVFNIPPYFSTATLSNLFEVAGNIERITCFNSLENTKNRFKTEDKCFKNETVKGFQNAYLVYKKTDSINLILNLKKLTLQKQLQRHGVIKWTNSYNDRIMHVDEIQKAVDEFMEKYDKIKNAEKDYVDGEQDDEGWITVPKNAGFKQKESVINKLEGKMRQQKKESKLKNFYTFEVRESKKEQLLELRKKFEGDKQKMESMKKSRRFKPF